MPHESKDDSRTNRLPTVSVGMPVYNGERYLRAAIDSLLAQDYSDFELTISDNASEDQTEAICREYAAHDSRIRYYRAEKNMGAVWNFNRVFELSRGEYFMWAAFDDLRAPQFIRYCVQALEAQPGAALCCTDIRLIDEHGRDADESMFTRGLRPSGASARARIEALARSTYWYDFYGLIRASVLAQTRPLQPVWGFDVVKVMELCLRGEVAVVPEKLFSYRVFLDKKGQDAAATLGSAESGGRIPMNWGHFSLEMAKSIWLAPLRTTEKLDLTIRFLIYFCVRNPVVSAGLRGDSMSYAWQALARGRGLLFFWLALINPLAFTLRLICRVRDSARYRLSRRDGKSSLA